MTQNGNIPFLIAYLYNVGLLVGQFGVFFWVYASLEIKELKVRLGWVLRDKSLDLGGEEDIKKEEE